MGATVTLQERDDEGLGALARHVLEEGLGALLVSTRADVLDRVARQLVHALRQHGANRDVQVAILFEMSRELLLDRFNQRIAHLSVQAARLEKPGPPAQVWVLHVGNDEQVSLARLLARLVHDFPGSGVRLVMLASPSADAKLDTGPELQRLLRCMVIAEASETGLEDSYSAGHEAADAEPASGAIAGPGPGGDVRRALPTAASAPDNRSPASPGRMLRLVTGGLLALGFSILVVMFLLPARPQRPAVSPVAIADPVAPAQESAAPQASGRPEGGSPPVSVETERPVQAGSPTAAQPPVSTPVGESIAESISPPVGEPSARPSAGDTPAPAPGAAEGKDWVLSLVRGQWVVQHVAVRTREEAYAWRLRTPALADARIVALARREEGERYFVVVSGPFADRDAATRFVQQQRLAVTTSIRGAASLKASLPPEAPRR